MYHHRQATSREIADSPLKQTVNVDGIAFRMLFRSNPRGATALQNMLRNYESNIRGNVLKLMVGYLYLVTQVDDEGKVKAQQDFCSTQQDVHVGICKILVT